MKLLCGLFDIRLSVGFFNIILWLIRFLSTAILSSQLKKATLHKLISSVKIIVVIYLLFYVNAYCIATQNQQMFCDAIITSLH